MKSSWLGILVLSASKSNVYKDVQRCLCSTFDNSSFPALYSPTVISTRLCTQKNGAKYYYFINFSSFNFDVKIMRQNFKIDLKFSCNPAVMNSRGNLCA